MHPTFNTYFNTYFIMVNNNIILVDTVRVSSITKLPKYPRFVVVVFCDIEYYPNCLIIGDNVFLLANRLESDINAIYQNTCLSFSDFIKKFPVCSQNNTFYHVEF